MISSLGRRAPLRIAAVLFLGGCALPAAQEGGVVAPPSNAVTGEWRFGTREHVSLWYHALSFVLPAVGKPPIPIYDTAERDAALAAARRAGVSRTPMQQRADSIAREFAGSSTYDQLQFLPLYFDDADALFNGIRAWDQAGGDPARAASGGAREAVALLSAMFDTPRLRRWVVQFAGIVQQERSAYYQAYWSQREPGLRARADSARAFWLQLQQPLQPLLRHLQVRGGEVLLTPSLGAEGRTVTTQALLRTAVGGGGASVGAQDVAWELIHELMYSLVTDVVQQHVAPAVLADLGEAAVTSSAATRAGALVLERLVPAHAPAYRRLYLRAAGRSGSDVAAFQAAFPLPSDLERGLARAVEEALAGI